MSRKNSNLSTKLITLIHANYLLTMANYYSTSMSILLLNTAAFN